MSKAIVIEHYAQPRDQGGGTRHVDLFDRLQGWETTFVASNVSHYTQKPYTTSDPRFVMAKPSVIAVIVGVFMLKPGWLSRYLPEIVTARRIYSSPSATLTASFPLRYATPWLT